MGNFLGTLLYFLVLLVAVFGIMYFGNKYVFSKVRINKYIPLGIAIALFILQIFMPVILGKNINIYINYINCYFLFMVYGHRYNWWT